jgi:hypothetical protein
VEEEGVEPFEVSMLTSPFDEGLLGVEVDPKVLGKGLVVEELVLVWLPLEPNGPVLLDMNGKTELDEGAAGCPKLKGVPIGLPVSFFSVVVLVLKLGKFEVDVELPVTKLGNIPTPVATGEVFVCALVVERGAPNTKLVEVEVVVELLLGDVFTEENPANTAV